MINKIKLQSGEVYEFRADWGFIDSMQQAGHNAYSTFTNLHGDSPCPIGIKTVLQHSIRVIDGADVKSPDDAAITFIALKGLQESQYLAMDILTAILIGDEKKQALNSQKMLTEVIKQIFPTFRRKSFLILGSIWVATACASGMLGGVILNSF